MAEKDFYIANVVNSNKPDEEFVRLKVSSSLEKPFLIEGYAILDLTFIEGAKSNVHRHVFTLPKGELNPGDFIRVYTGSGSLQHYNNDKGTVTYLLYMNLDECIWNDDKHDSAMLIKYEIVDWKKVPKFKKS